MAKADFSVTVSDVTDKLPVVADQIGTNTAPLSTGIVEDLIQDGESEFAELLRRNGADPSNLTDDEKRQVQAAVEAYAVKEAMDILGATGEKYNRYSRKWNRLWERFNSDSSQAGGSTTGSRVHTNINPDENNLHDKQEMDDFTDPTLEF